MAPEGQNRIVFWLLKLCLNLLIADNFIEVFQMLIILCRHYNIIPRYRICFFQNFKSPIISWVTLSEFSGDKASSFSLNMIDYAKIKKVTNVSEQGFYPFNLWWANQTGKKSKWNIAKDNRKEIEFEDLVVHSSCFLSMKFI